MTAADTVSGTAPGTVFSRARRPELRRAPKHGRRPYARRRAAVAALCLAVGVSVLAVPTPDGQPVLAQTDEEAAQRAAREIQDARDRANAAAEAFFQAQSDLEVLEDDVVRLEAEAEQLVADIERLRGEVESVAINRFMSTGASGIPLFTNVQKPQDQVQATVFVDVLRNSSVDLLDLYDAARDELLDNRAELEVRRAEIENAKVVFTSMQKRAEEEVEELREIEEQRLSDEAVRKALEAEIAAERARIEEEARREAEAAARAVPDVAAEIAVPTTVAPDGADDADPGAAGSGTDTPATDPAGDGAAGSDAGSDAGNDGAADDDPPAPEPTSPPVSTVPQNSGGAGGSSGGRTGTGGGGNSPRGVTSGGVYVDAISCPILGSGYGDTWGAPRSGGRRHQGVDMIAPEGVPLFAVTSGVVRFGQNRLGGNAVSLLGDNGNRYYYAHLVSFEGATGRRVEAGEVIGYNGATGNASVPHLHFEIRPGGGVPVNPYPSVRAAGC